MIEQQSSSPQASAITKEGYARIKQRLTELLQILMEDMQSDPTAQTMGLTAMAPVVVMMIQQYDGAKLMQLLTCLAGISQAVSSSDYSQEQYEDAIVPYVKGLQEALS